MHPENLATRPAGTKCCCDVMAEQQHGCGDFEHSCKDCPLTKHSNHGYRFDCIDCRREGRA